MLRVGARLWSSPPPDDELLPCNLLRFAADTGIKTWAHGVRSSTTCTGSATRLSGDWLLWVRSP